MRVALLSPIQSSPYSRLVTHLLARTPGIEMVGSLVRTPWTWSRIKSEFRRDGVRLLRKAYRKLILRERDFDPTVKDHLMGLAQESGLPGTTLDDVCRFHGIPCLEFHDHHAPEALDFLRSMRPEVIVFTGGGLLRKNLLEIASKGVVNCHMGPLPRYRGMDVVEYPVLEGRLNQEGIGLTLHYIDAGVDTGPILLQEKIEPRHAETFALLRHRMERKMVELMVEGIRKLAEGSIEPRPQSPADGRQYYVMHPRIQQLAAERLKHLFRAA